MKKEDLIKFYYKYNLFIFPAAVALSSLFIIFFVIYPQVIKLIDNQAAVEELLNKSKTLENKVSALENYDNSDLSRKLEFALATLPGEKDFGSVMGLLQKLTMDAGFSISSISFGNTAGKLGSADSFEVKLELKGSRLMLKDLLTNLESSPRLVRVKSIDISSNQAAKNLDVALAIEVLYSPLPRDFGGPESPIPVLSQKDEELLSRISEEAAVISGSSANLLSPRGKANPFE